MYLYAMYAWHIPVCHVCLTCIRMPCKPDIYLYAMYAWHVSVCHVCLTCICMPCTPDMYLYAIYAWHISVCHVCLMCTCLQLLWVWVPPRRCDPTRATWWRWGGWSLAAPRVCWPRPSSWPTTWTSRRSRPSRRGWRMSTLKPVSLFTSSVCVCVCVCVCGVCVVCVWCVCVSCMCDLHVCIDVCVCCAYMCTYSFCRCVSMHALEFDFYTVNMLFVFDCKIPEAHLGW